MKALVVTGNCQVSGIAEALGYLLPQVDCRAVAIGWPEEMWANEGRALVASSDYWVRMDTPRDHLLQEPGQPSPPVIRIPSIHFTAFHPDQVFATSPGGQFQGITAYHSAIGLWAWKRGLAPDQAAELFTPSVMNGLGYAQYWQPSYFELRDQFGSSSLDFGEFWLRLKRLGVFMHTVNHPRIEAVALLAKSIAVTLGAPSTVWDEPVERYLQDGLATAVWPVHPPVALALGVVGSDRWRLLHHVYTSVHEFLDATWSSYAGTDPESVFCPRVDDARYEAVLTQELRLAMKGVRP